MLGRRIIVARSHYLTTLQNTLHCPRTFFLCIYSGLYNWLCLSHSQVSKAVEAADHHFALFHSQQLVDNNVTCCYKS